MNKKYLTTGAGIVAALLSSTAFSDNMGITPIQNPPTFTFSSFGTIGVVQTNTDNGVYTTTNLQKNGATKEADFGPDTKAGAQLDTKFNDELSATLQVLSKQNSSGSYEPEVEWAFAKMKIGGGFDLRLGRIGGPFFMSSDFRNVGYTNVSVRTPVDVYGLVPITHFDGGDLLYKTNIGDTTINGQLWLGKSSVIAERTSAGDSIIDINNLVGLNLSVETGPLTLRIGRAKSRLSLSGTGFDSYNTLIATLNQLSAAPGLSSLATIANDMAVDNSFASFTGVGAILDLGNWIVSGEYVKRESESDFISSNNAWYTTFGYRINTFTPYVSYSKRSTTSTTSFATPAVSPFLPPQTQAAVPVLVGSVNALLIPTDETSTAIGVRWDAGKNYDIKAEFQQIRVPAGSAGIFSNVQGGFYSVDTRINVMSLAVDFVF